MSKTIPITLSLLACILLLGACSDAAKDTHPQKLVSQRVAVFKKMTQTLEPLGQVARGRKDYVKPEFVEGAQALKDLASQPWAFFTADGNYPPTHAKPEVWSQPTDFKQAQDKFLANVDKLVAVAGNGDLPTISTAVNDIEVSCKNCHQQFRNER